MGLQGHEFKEGIAKGLLQASLEAYRVILKIYK
jgi:hypothetical protein